MALKAIIATLILGTSSLALAAPHQREQRDEHRVGRDRTELRQDRRELRADQRFGAGPRELRHDRAELRDDRGDLRRDRNLEARDHRFERERRSERTHQVRRERSDWILATPPDEILGELALLFGDHGVAFELFRVDDREVEAGLHAMVQHHRVEDFSASFRQSK